MAAVKNALEKTRSAAVRAVKAPARGAAWTSKRIRWRGGEAAQGVRRGLGRVGSALESPRTRLAGAGETARQRPRSAIAIAAAVLIGVAWIAWTIYVTASNGAAAGLGVLLTWPVLVGALALIAAPFVLTGMLVQRHRASTPAMAGAPAVPDPPKQKAGKQEEKADPAEVNQEPAPTEEQKESEPEEDPAASSA